MTSGMLDDGQITQYFWKIINNQLRSIRIWYTSRNKIQITHSGMFHVWDILELARKLCGVAIRDTCNQFKRGMREVGQLPPSTPFLFFVKSCATFMKLRGKPCASEANQYRKAAFWYSDIFGKITPPGVLIVSLNGDRHTYFIATPPYRGWQRSEGRLLLHSFLSLDMFVAFSILRFGTWDRHVLPCRNQFLFLADRDAAPQNRHEYDIRECNTTFEEESVSSAI